ncbi:hypothetical protein [Microbacterium sp. NPDC080220]|uniref:hypothetical protein n=1 Tax=Microbacterium sp. NPDC080220 TaxID=3161017 RepID=UPI003428FFDC
MRKLGVVSVAAAVLLLAGCSGTSAQDAGVRLCVDDLQYEIEQALPVPAAGWLDSELSTENVVAVPMESDGVEASDISGVAVVALSDGSEVSARWTCFAQRVDGKDYATVLSIDGFCSTAYTGNNPSVCKPRD